MTEIIQKSYAFIPLTIADPIPTDTLKIKQTLSISEPIPTDTLRIRKTLTITKI